jgi:hypothetical protein
VSLVNKNGLIRQEMTKPRMDNDSLTAYNESQQAWMLNQKVKTMVKNGLSALVVCCAVLVTPSISQADIWNGFEDLQPVSRLFEGDLQLTSTTKSYCDSCVDETCTSADCCTSTACGCYDSIVPNMIGTGGLNIPLRFGSLPVAIQSQFTRVSNNNSVIPQDRVAFGYGMRRYSW